MRLLFLLILIFVSTDVKANRWPANVLLDSSIYPSMENLIVLYTFDLNKELQIEAFTFDRKNNNFPILVKYNPKNPNNGVAGLATIYANFCEITIYPVALEPDLLKTVLWHEYGHCLGMMHLNERNQIMSPRVTNFKTYPKENIDLFLTSFKKFFKMVSR